MNQLAKELAYAARTLRKNPLFALTAMATVALGIGASTAIFSVVNAVLLRPLPYADEGQLALVWGDLRNRGVKDFPVSPGDLYDLRREANLFQDLAAVTTFRQAIAGDDGQPEQIQAGAVTTNFFRLLGARTAIGRDFTDQDGVVPPRPPQPAGPAIAILSYEFWKRRFGSDAGVVGRSVDFGGGRAEIVGVLQPGFELLYPPNTNIERVPDLWTAMRIDLEGGSRINHFLRTIGRLKPGVTVQQAQAQIEGITTELRQRFPIKETAGLYYRVEPMHEDLVADVRPSIKALMGAVIFVLLIACANVANLLLVRAWQRERELAVRAALGGGRWDLVRQMLAESLVLAGGGALLGLGLAQLGLKLLLVLGPEGLPRIESVTIDLVVLGFTALSTLVAAAAFGVVPALQASRPDLAQALRASGRITGPGAGLLLRNGVVMAEVALSFVLLIGCGLMVRSFVALQRARPGYEADGVLTFALSNLRVRSREERIALVRELKDRLRALPGVQSVSASSSIPLDGENSNGRWGTEEALADPIQFQQATFRWVLPGYFETLRTPLVEGRTFADGDDAPNLQLMIIDSRLAAKAFPNQSAVGKRLLARLGGDTAQWFDVIGVVGHQRDTSLSRDSREALFFPDGGASARWVVRTAGDPSGVAAVVRAEIARINPRLLVSELQPMRVLVEHAQARTRFALALIGIFAVIAALLAAVGLYGVLSTFVRQRTREIGVRMAFGAPRASILQLVIGQGLRMSGIGIACGLVAALALTRVMASMLVGVKASDPATFATIAVLFLAIAALASWLPARRAAGLDPAIALREE